MHADFVIEREMNQKNNKYKYDIIFFQKHVHGNKMSVMCATINTIFAEKAKLNWEILERNLFSSIYIFKI